MAMSAPLTVTLIAFADTCSQRSNSMLISFNMFAALVARKAHGITSQFLLRSKVHPTIKMGAL